MSTIVSTDELVAAVSMRADLIAEHVTHGRVTAPTVDEHGDERWDLPTVRAELGRIRRVRDRRRFGRMTRAAVAAVNRKHAARCVRRDRAAATVAVKHVDDTLTQVSDGLGRQLGSVMLGDTLTRSGVWLVQPLSRAEHANTWDLPWAPTREDAVRMLATGDYTL